MTVHTNTERIRKAERIIRWIFGFAGVALIIFGLYALLGWGGIALAVGLFLLTASIATS